MNNNSNFSDNLNKLVNQAIASSQQLLTDFALNPLFDANLGLILGENIDPEKAQKIRQSWIKGIFEDSPEIEIVPKADLNNANGVYVTQLNKIFLAEEFLQANSTNLTAIIDLYLEEFGHFVDSQINKSEAPGDEGRIFAELVQGNELAETELEILRIEDDAAFIELDGNTFKVEQADFSFLGNITWTDFEGKDYKLQDAIVRVIDSNTGGVLGEDATDVDGNYQIDININGTEDIGNEKEIFIEVLSANEKHIIRPGISSPTPINEAYSQVIGTFTLPSTGNISFFQNFKIDNQEPKDIAFAIHQALLIGEIFAFDAGVSLTSNNSPLLVNFPAPDNDSSFFSPFEDKYTGEPNIFITDKRRWSWDVILHEYGHYITDVDDLTPNIGGSHSAGVSNIPTRGKLKGTRLAWSEGLATYLGIAAQEVAQIENLLPPYKFTNNTFYDALDQNGIKKFSFDLETTSGLSEKGEGDELAVARILYDIADGKNEAHDEIEVGHVKLYQELKNINLQEQQSGKELDRIDDLWNYFINNPNKLNLPDNLSESEKIAKLGAVFEKNSISPQPKGELIIDNELAQGASVPTFEWNHGNNNANDRFQVFVFNEDFSEILLLSGPLLETSWTPDNLDWKQNVANKQGVYHFVVSGEDFKNNQGNTYSSVEQTGAYWSGAKTFTITEEESPSDPNLLSVQDFINELEKLLSPLQVALNSSDFGTVQFPFLGNLFDSSSTQASNINFQVASEPISPVSNPLNFINQVNYALAQELQSLGDKASIQEIEQAFFDALGSKKLDVLKDLNGDNQITKDDVGLTIDADDIRFDLSLGSEKSFFERSIQGDFGLPYLGLSVGEDANSQVKLGVGYDFNFSFGVKDGEFFLDTPSDEDIKVSLEASIPDLDLQGQIGFLQVNVKDEDTDEIDSNDGLDADGDGIAPSFFEVGVAVDLEGATVKNIEQVGTGELNVNLLGSLGGIDYLPSIDSDLNIIWNDLINGSPEIAFNNVTLDLGSFFDKFTDPVFETIGKVTKPLGTVTNIINSDLPLIKTSLLDMAEFFGEDIAETTKFIETFNQINEVIKIVDSIPDSSRINLGSFKVGNVNENGNSLINATIIEPNSPNPLELEEQIGQQSEQHNQFITIAETPNIEFPIITEPTTAFNLLLGKSADLFQLNLGTIGFGFEYDFPAVPLFGPVSLFGGVSGAAAANLSLGFDTYGLEQFRDTGDAGQLSQGLYFTTSDVGTPPHPLPDREFTVGVGALTEIGAGVNFGPISAAILGGINGNLFLDLAEERTRVEDFANPGCILELAGALDFILSLKLKLGFGPFSISKRIGLLRETLADFSAGCSGHGKDIGQATKEEDGVLILRVGDEAKNLDVEEIEEDELITVKHIGGTFGNESVQVITYGLMQTYDEIRKIVGDAKDGNDIIQIGENVLTPAELKGGNGEDDITGGRGDDTIRGGNDSDALFGGQGNDEIFGEDGDDYLYGEKGDDTLDGGDGEDIVSYATASSAVDIHLSLGEDSYAFDGEGGNDFLISIEQIEGSVYNDTIIGSDDKDRIDGGDGDDILSGGADNDFLMGGNGSDTLDGGEGQDGTTYAGAIANVYIDLENDFVFDGDGSIDVLISVESVQASSYDDMVIGDGGNNLLDASDGDDTVIGGAGNDNLDGGGIRNSSIGNQDIDSHGIDLLSYIQSPSGVNVSLKNGEAKNDGYGSKDKIERAKKLTSNSPDEEPSSSDTEYSSFENLRGSNHSDSLLEGDIGNNRIEGLDGDDTIKGADGEDTLIGDRGADNLDGGNDDDLADYSLSTDYVIVNLAAGVGFNGHAEGDTFVQSGGQATVENLLGSRYGDTLIGDDGDNEINPGLSNGYFSESQGQIDFVSGGNGSDLLIIDYSRQDYRGTGMTGGFSNDSATSGFISRRNISNNEIIQDAVSFEGIDRSYIIGTIKDDQINGGLGSDTLLLGAGNDTINGGAGNDVLRGDEGNDLLIGGDGDDSIFGGDGFDKASYITSNIPVSVDLELGQLVITVLPPPFNTTKFSRIDTFNSIEALQGSIYRDNLDGDSNNNLLEGMQGDDVLEGQGGADTIDGGEGNDTASYFSSTEAVNISLTTGILSGGDAEGDRLISIENLSGSEHNDFLEGNDNNNDLVGRSGNDVLQGGNGDDDINGGSGNDLLLGGKGNDTLKGSFFNTSLSDIDTLTGGTEADQFWLGDINGDFYSDQVYEYATIITDFNPNEGDKIQLHRCEWDYELKDLGDGVGIYSDFNRNSIRVDNNLIGVLQGLSLSEVDKTDDFIYLGQNCSSRLL